MRLLLLLLLCVIPVGALAAPIQVTSGDHEGFTRLVLQMSKVEDWRFGRTAEGYELSMASGAPRYDLTKAFDLISKNRVAAIWADPVSGNLKLTVSCACFAIPFELRPGVIVIDVRDGRASAESSFELALDGSKPPNLVDRSQTRPTARPPLNRSGVAIPLHVWRDVVFEAARVPPIKGQLRDVMANEFSAIRDTLNFELARGAASGIVDLAHPLPLYGTSPKPVPSKLRLVLGDRPGVLIGNGRPKLGSLTSDGHKCLTDGELDIGNWAGETAVANQIADARNGLYGEFDQLDQDSAGRTIRYYLNIGFGAEALQVMSLDSNTEGELKKAWRSIALIEDGRFDPESIFNGMAVCDTAAALWAALSKPTLEANHRINASAVRRSFVALPPHLRRLLGPQLVERFIEIKDNETVRVLQSAMLRVSGLDGNTPGLQDAQEAIAVGRTGDAQAELEPKFEGNGAATSQALLRKVRARLAADLPIVADDVIALEALALELRGTQGAGQLQTMVVLAKAASGEFASAFADLAKTPEAAAGVWQVLLAHGTDDDFLAWAVFQDVPPPELSVGLRTGISRRLIELGFGSAALTWLGVPPVDQPTAAQALLLEGDARGALQMTAGATDEVSVKAREAALDQLGEYSASVEFKAARKDVAGANRTLAWAHNWAELAVSAPEPWLAAARSLEKNSSSGLSTGLLKNAEILIEESVDTRRHLEGLLAETTPQ